MLSGSCTVGVGAVNSGPGNQAAKYVPSVSQPATLIASKMAVTHAPARATPIGTRLPRGSLPHRYHPAASPASAHDITRTHGLEVHSGHSCLKTTSMRDCGKRRAAE